MVWTAHVNGRQHREKVSALKNPAAETQFAKPEVVVGLKRKADVGNTPSPSKKGIPSDFFDNKKPILSSKPSVPIKSILKNAPVKTSSQSLNQVTMSDISKSVDTPMETDQLVHSSSYNATLSDKPPSKIENPPTAVPEGFFDDPKLDAKVFFLSFV